MKRLSALFSDSDSDESNNIKHKNVHKKSKTHQNDDFDSLECDINEIKKQYQGNKKDTVKKSTSKANKDIKKNKNLNDNQISIETAFSKVKPVKRPAQNCLEQYFQKDNKMPYKEVSACDYFASSKKSKDSDIIISPVKKEAIKNSSESQKFVIEKSPVKIKKDILNKTFRASDSFSTPTKDSQTKDTPTSPPQSASKKAYHAYLNRQGPSALGCKEIPEGQPNCLMGMTFVMTGVLDSLERDDAQKLIEKYGGRVTKALSGKTTYLIVGSESGESKIQKAQKLNTKQINEDDLFNLIRNSVVKNIPPIKTPNRKQSAVLLPIKEEKATPSMLAEKTHNSNHIATKIKESKSDIPLSNKFHSTISTNIDNNKTSNLSAKPIVNTSVQKENVNNISKANPMLLVDKYKPTTMKQIIGQQGDRSPANKLLHWLNNWEKNYKQDFKKNEEGDHFRAVLLSGSPGIGKTTTAHIVCKQLGYNIKEYNASSSRSKKHLNEVNASAQNKNAFSFSEGQKICIIMDEIDGMAGNEDRGGIGELTNIIKTTKTPIICICNDRQSMKLRSIANHLYDLRYRQLTVDQIKAAMKSVAFKEKISIPDDAFNEIIAASNFDLRQVFNNLQLWSATTMNSEEVISDARKGHKEFKLGPFDVIKRVFSHEHVKTFSEKLDLFYEDYQLGGLFVQENYLNVAPRGCRNDMHKTLKLMSLAADSIATSDIVSRKLRTTNNWGLLPIQGMFASVLPGEYLHGNLTARIEFPSWLGKFSKQNKTSRILTTLSMHLRSSTRGGVSNSSILALDYGQLLVRRLLTPLREGDIETTLKMLNKLKLMREDIELLVEATSWPNCKDLLAGVSSQMKASLTRAFNKANFKLPYKVIDLKKSRQTGGPIDEDGELEEDLNETADTNDNEDGLDNDRMIMKKQSKAPAASKPKKAASTKAKKKETVQKTKNK